MLNVYEKNLNSVIRDTNNPHSGICIVLEDSGEQVGTAEVAIGEQVGTAEVAIGEQYYLQLIDCADVYFDFFNRSILYILTNKLCSFICVPIEEHNEMCSLESVDSKGDKLPIIDCSVDKLSGLNKYRGKSRIDYYKQFGFKVAHNDKYLIVNSHELVFPHECSK